MNCRLKSFLSPRHEFQLPFRWVVSQDVDGVVWPLNTAQCSLHVL
jgi:hypothetical protein